MNDPRKKDIARKNAVHGFRKRQYYGEMQIAMVEQVLRYGTVTIDEVRVKVNRPKGVGPGCHGMVSRELAELGIIERVGAVRSNRPAAKSRAIGFWKLKDKRKAKAILSSRLSPPQIKLTKNKAPVVLATEALSDSTNEKENNEGNPIHE